jgi:PKD repeat protein
MHFIRLSFLLCLLSLTGFAQTDNTFWFAAPDISSVHGDPPRNGAPINLHITAVYATHVTISRPADPGFTPIEFDLNEMEHRSIRLDNYPGLAIDRIENYPMPDLVTGVQDKGFLIEAEPGEITAYYELDQYWNRDIFPLKGKNALGKEFRVSTQNYFPNGDYSGTAFSGFVIVATEDNTTVTVYQNAAWFNFPVPATRTIVLDRGETFAFRAASTAAAQHINGVRVTSDKDIAITVYDDSIRKKNTAGGACTSNLSYDVAGDQTVPLDLIGLEYIVMKGEVTVSPACDGGERIFITSTQPNTQIFVDGVLQTTMVAAGSVYSYQISNNSTHIRGSKPIYIFHTTGFGGELGGAVLPTIDGCTGSQDVTFTRTPNALDQFYVNIMVRNDTATGSPFRNQAINNFTITVGGITDVIPAAYFEYIMDSAFAVLKALPAADAFFAGHIPPGEEARISNSTSRFHLGVINGGASTGCKYGYFSDYAASGASAGLGGATAVTQDVYCNLDPIRLVASGGIGYRWKCISDPAVTQLITDTTIADPYFYPVDTGDFIFTVKIYGECFMDTSISMLARVYIGPTSDFTISQNEGCSPFTTTFTNTTNIGYAKEMIWVFYNPYLEINQDTSDTMQTYRVRLYSFARYHSCRSVREKYVKVKPQIKAAFSADPLVGCHPLITAFTDSSYGHIDSTSYYWDFGDNTQSFEQNPVHSYDNYGLKDTTYTIQLLMESPFGCLDSITHSVTVHPRVRTSMAIGTSASCSPLDITIDPGNSIGVDTFYWHVQSPTADTTYQTQSYNPVTLFHQDITYAGPDTIYINLIGMNRMGCTDTFPERNIIVFPEVNALFEIPDDTICDGDSILFTNSTQGFQLFYNWDFDNGTVFQDTTGSDFTQSFYNRSDADSSFRVTLTATSGYFCESEFDTVIVVHPYVKANFGLDYENNCTPILSTFSNLSIRGHEFEWDFGDGTGSTTPAASFTHQYWNNDPDNDTTYIIRLVARNNEGCSDTTYRTIGILPHVVAAFGISDSVGCSPLTVALTNSSSGGLLSYLWDFGNGTSSTNPSPIPRIYTNYTDNDTTYIISLTAINPYGCDSTTYDTVDVLAYIDADFNLTRTDSCSPFVLHTDNLSSAGAHFFEWDLLNSGLPTDYNAIPDFGTLSNTGITTDTLYLRLIAYGAVDPEHLACADRDSVRILVYPELDVDFTLSSMASCQPYVSTITNNTNLPSGNSFQWYIDSTFYSSARDPLPLNIPNFEDYDVNHTIRLTGESNHGCRDTALQTITVYSLVDARFTINKSGICSADSFEIDRRTTRGGITSYEWNFAGTIDNRTDSLFNYSFDNTTLSVPVQKQITLTVYNSHSCSSGISRNIDVYPEVRSAFTIDDSTACYPHLTTFTNNTENANTYMWDFGDGTGSTNFTPVPHEFNNFDNVTDQTYTINLIARSTYNCYDTISHDITIYAKPDAEFYFPVLVDCPPFEASMVNESEGFNLTYLWDFGDGTTSPLENPDHIFSNPGSTVADIPITLTVTSGMGCQDTVVRVLSVYPDVVVNLTMSESEGCSPLTVSFNGTAPNVNSMIWYIDGQPFSTLEDPSYRFTNNTPDTRVYAVTFSGHSIYGCGDDTTRNITVFSSPSAEFIPDPVIQDYNMVEDQTTVTFNNETYFQDNWAYFWDFGDGNTSNTDEASFDYTYGYEFWGIEANDFRIPVYMVAWNNEREECRDTVFGEVYIRPPLPQIDLEDDVAGCVPLTINFSATTRYIYEDQMLWDFGVPGATSTEAEPTYTYTEPDVYTVKLIVHGEGGVNWDYRIITVNPKPEIDFTFNDSIVFVRSQNHPDEIINFYNRTRYGQDYWWFFEETVENGVEPIVDMANAQSTEEEPTWYYENPGIYHVVLMAASDEGCLDTMVHPIAIHVLGEGQIQFPTGFFVDPTTPPRDEYVADPEDPSRNIFRAYGQGVAEFHLEVYNRWGVLVFRSDDINYGWNGYLNGKPAKQDVYVWRVKGRFTNGEPFEMSGDVTLIVAPDIGQVH